MTKEMVRLKKMLITLDELMINATYYDDEIMMMKNKKMFANLQKKIFIIV